MSRTVSCENIITDIMFHGFKKAEDSFSRFIGDKVSIENNLHSNKAADIISTLEDSFTTSRTIVLTTDLMGEFAGRSYLFITQEESEIIQNILGKQFKSITSPEFLNAMLLEIDNVVSAAVITELSNKLKITLYGGVPGVLNVIESKELSVYKTRELAVDKMLFYMTTFHLTSYPNVKLEFVWKLNSRVLELAIAQLGEVNNE